MRRNYLLFAVFVLIAPGCMAYLTHKEIGCRRLWNLDIESVPTPTGPTTTPLTPHHHQQKQQQQPPAAPPGPKAANVEIIYLPEPSPQVKQTPAPPIAVKDVAPPIP